MKSKTLIEKQSQRKRNPDLLETIRNAKKNKSWVEIASILSNPRRKSMSLNLYEIDKIAKEGNTLIIPGKVLSMGEITKKIKISALRFSENAKQKLKEQKILFNYINEEIKSNPEAKKITIIK